MNLSQREWPEGTEAARSLVAKALLAARTEIDPPVGARSRTWSAIEARRGRRALSRSWLGLAPASAFVAALVAARALLAPSPAPSLAGTEYAAGARRLLDVHGAADVVLGAQTRARIVEDGAAGIAFSLERGSLLAEVRHRPDGAPFIVHTPRADVKVVGTVLWVNVSDDGEATVLVGRGAVEVSAPASPTGPGGHARVAAGQRWPAASARTPDAADLALLGPRLLDGSQFAAPVAGAADSCRGLAGAEAIACLDELARSGDRLRAESALYEKGWRQLRDLGDARAALGTWLDERDRFPEGVLGLEVDASIIQASVKLDDRPRARREIDGFFAAHAAAFQVPEIHFLLGTIERADGNCARAVREFDVALRSPSEPWASVARTQRDACQHAAP